jgi:hypothetical protein
MELREIEIYLAEQVKAELKLQKHRATGKLIDSFKVKSRHVEGVIYIEGFMNDYGEWVDTGRAVRRTKVPVQALIEWVRQKGIASGDKAKGVAFAIREKIYQEGIPTRGSRRLAPRRQRFIKYALDGADKLPQMIKDYGMGQVEAMLHNLIEDVKKPIV